MIQDKDTESGYGKTMTIDSIQADSIDAYIPKSLSLEGARMKPAGSSIAKSGHGR